MKLVARASFAAMIAVAGAAQSNDIGAVAAVNRDVKGARPAEEPRRLLLNDRLIQNERVTTSANSGGQVMFLDQTTLTLTPNSDIILDKYVFDPAADKGELAVTMLKGAMRMVGGRITKSSVATIRTPSATIGIRGGIGNITVREDGTTEYMHIAGFSATITNAKKDSITITREGGMAEVSPPAGGVEAFTASVTGSSDGGVDSATTAVNQQLQANAAPSDEEQDSGGAATGGSTQGGEPSGGGDGSDGQGAAQSGAGTGADDGQETAGSAENVGASGDAETSEASDAPASGDAAPDDGVAAAGATEASDDGGGSEGGSVAGGGATTGAGASGGDTGGAETGATSSDGGGQITFLGVATPEQVRATMQKRAGDGDYGGASPQAGQRIRAGVVAIEQEISARPNAIINAPISTVGERQEEEYAPLPVNLDDRPIEEFTDNEVAMATEAEKAAQQIAQELNAVSFSGVWSATAGLLSGGFAPTQDDLAFRMRYSLLDQEGFVTIELPGGEDGTVLTAFDGATLTGDRFLVVGDDARAVVADTERLTLLGGDADGSALTISASDVANGTIFIDYDGVGLSQLQFVDGQVVGLTGQRGPTTDVRTGVTNLRQIVNEPGN